VAKSSAHAAKPCQKEHGCNVARQQKKPIGYVGFMEAESSGWKPAVVIIPTKPNLLVR
jgi:hypothetical protein